MGERNKEEAMLVLEKLAERWSKDFMVVEDCGSAQSVDGKVSFEMAAGKPIYLSKGPNPLAMILYHLSTCRSNRPPLSTRGLAEYSKMHYISIY